jgi:hypothetical protein
MEQIRSAMKFIYTINKSHPGGRQKNIEKKKKKKRRSSTYVGHGAYDDASC